MTYLATFDLVFSTKARYTAFIFQEGSVLVHNRGLSSGLKEGQKIEAVYTHNDTRRKSYDRVLVYLMDVLYTLIKPRLVSDVMRAIEEKKTIFLAKMAIKSIVEWVKTTTNCQWITEAKYRSGLLPLIHPDITVLKGIDEAPTKEQVQKCPSEYTLADKQYPCIKDTKNLLNCQFCHENFKYLTENVHHLIQKSDCVKALNVPKVDQDTFYSIWAKSIDDKFGDEKMSLQCNVCPDFETSSPFHYALHRDQHVPPCSNIYICIACTVIFVTPFAFYMHPCLGSLDGFKEDSKRDKMHQGSFCIHKNVNRS